MARVPTTAENASAFAALSHRDALALDERDLAAFEELWTADGVLEYSRPDPIVSPRDDSARTCNSIRRWNAWPPTSGPCTS
jgi:hypothetical protein